MGNRPQRWKPNQKRNEIHKVNFATSTSIQEEGDDFTTILHAGSSDSNPFCAIIDTGCPKTVAGRKWMDAFTETQGNPLKRTCDNEKFKFVSVK